MILRCTSKVIDLLGRRSVAVVEAAPSDDDWYANLLWLDRRKCLLFMHAGTLFPILAVDVRKHELEPLGPFVVRLIERSPAAEHLPGDALGRLNPNELRLARTPAEASSGS